MSSTLKNIVKQTKLKKERETVKEPVRESLYDVLLQNLERANRTTFLHRLIYAGYHDFGVASEQAVQIFSKNVSNTNNLGGFELLTGFYLHYPNHFLHMVEADEDTINNHLRLLYSSGDANNFKDMKVIVNLNHILYRLTEDWTSYSGLPNTLLNPPVRTENDAISDTTLHIYNCVIRVQKLVQKLNRTQSNTATISSIITTKPCPDSGLITSSRSSGFSSLRSSPFRDSPSFFMSANLSPYRDFIPETERLDYILTSPYSMDLREYFDMFGFVPQREIYKEKVWPVPADFIPYDLFVKDYERRVDMFEKANENVEDNEYKTEEIYLEEENKP